MSWIHPPVWPSTVPGQYLGVPIPTTIGCRSLPPTVTSYWRAVSEKQPDRESACLGAWHLRHAGQRVCGRLRQRRGQEVLAPAASSWRPSAHRAGARDSSPGRPGWPLTREGYIYVADWGNERVQVLDADGNFVQLLRGEATISEWAANFLSINQRGSRRPSHRRP